MSYQSSFDPHLLRRLILDQLEHVLDQPLELLLGDVPVPVDVKHSEDSRQRLLRRPVGHDVENQLESFHEEDSYKRQCEVTMNSTKSM